MGEIIKVRKAKVLAEIQGLRRGRNREKDRESNVLEKKSWAHKMRDR